MRIIIILSLFIGVFHSTLRAQLNVKVGYTAGFASPAHYNTILKDFNENSPWLDKTLSEISYLHGIQLGLRYHFGPAALDITWHNRFRRSESEGTNPADESLFERDINFQLSSYSIGIENFIGKFSYGGSFDVDNLNIRTKKTGRSDRFQLVNEYGLGSHFFVSYTFESASSLHFSIRPFLQIPWSKFNLSNLSDELNPGIDYQDQTQGFQNFGIMFLFFNGE